QWWIWKASRTAMSIRFPVVSNSVWRWPAR
ncbi:fe(3+) ions import ATP-binding protein FbpC, partial [Escherichia coli N1]